MAIKKDKGNNESNENELPQSMITVGFTAIVYLIIGIKILTLPII